jgi:hypothetical protein
LGASASPVPNPDRGEAAPPEHDSGRAGIDGLGGDEAADPGAWPTPIMAPNRQRPGRVSSPGLPRFPLPLPAMRIRDRGPCRLGPRQALSLSRTYRGPTMGRPTRPPPPLRPARTARSDRPRRPRHRA